MKKNSKNPVSELGAFVAYFYLFCVYYNRFPEKYYDYTSKKRKEWVMRPLSLITSVIILIASGVWAQDDTIAPSAPSNLQYDSITATSVYLYWSPSTENVDDLYGYDINESGGYWGITVSDTFVTVDRLTAGTEYKFSVVASDSNGNFSEATNEVVVSTKPDNTNPTKPGGAAATVLTPSSAQLSWSPSTDDNSVKEYNIYLRTAGGSDSLVTRELKDTTGVVFFLSPQVSYQFVVKATDVAGKESEPSDIIEVTTPSAIAKVLFVTHEEKPGDFPELYGSEQVIYLRMAEKGYEVNRKSYKFLPTSLEKTGATGYSCVVVSSSMLSSNLGGNLWTNIPINMLIMEAYVMDDMKLVDKESGLYYANSGNNRGDVTITDPVLAGGMTGTVSITDNTEEGIDIKWAIPKESGKVVATVDALDRIIPPENPPPTPAGTQAWIFVYEPGAELFSDSVAPAKRAFFGLNDNGSEQLNENGWKLFDGVFNWVMEGAVPWDGTLNQPASNASLTLTYPNGGDTLFIDSFYTITWESTGLIHQVNLDYSTDNATWKSIAEGVENSGSYEWTAPDDESNSVTIRVSNIYGTYSDQSDAALSIMTTPAPQTDEDGGERGGCGSGIGLAFLPLIGLSVTRMRKKMKK
jgi:hypothetical protein